jgi:hypothetical protein
LSVRRERRSQKKLRRFFSNLPGKFILQDAMPEQIRTSGVSMM